MGDATPASNEVSSETTDQEKPAPSSRIEEIPTVETMDEDVHSVSGASIELNESVQPSPIPANVSVPASPVPDVSTPGPRAISTADAVSPAKPAVSEDTSKTMPALVIAAVGLIGIAGWLAFAPSGDPRKPSPTVTTTSPTTTGASQSPVTVKPKTEAASQPRVAAADTSQKTVEVSPKTTPAPTPATVKKAATAETTTAVRDSKIEKQETERSVVEPVVTKSVRKDRAPSRKSSKGKSKSEGKTSLLAALQMDEEDDSLDVTKLGPMEGARLDKTKQRSSGSRADRLMNGNALEQLERKKRRP